MTLTKIEEKAKFITNKTGKPVEVILPYNIYKRLLDLEISMEIFKSKETQAGIKRARKDIRDGRIKNFDNVEDAVKWLDK